MREPTADLAHHFADLAVETKYSDLSADAVDAAKKTILDTLGVSSGGQRPRGVGRLGAGLRDESSAAAPKHR